MVDSCVVVRAHLVLSLVLAASGCGGADDVAGPAEAGVPDAAVVDAVHATVDARPDCGAFDGALVGVPQFGVQCGDEFCDPASHCCEEGGATCQPQVCLGWRECDGPEDCLTARACCEYAGDRVCWDTCMGAGGLELCHRDSDCYYTHRCGTGGFCVPRCS
jgi:hypothetical protein